MQIHMNEKFIIILPVYNSYDNLFDIIKEIKNSKLNVKKIIMIDNNSDISLNDKIKILKINREINKFNIDLIINKKLWNWW